MPALLLGAALAGCGSASTAPAAPPPPPVDQRASQPVGWDQQLRLPDAVDMNPAPDVVEVNLDAHVTQLEMKPGVTTSTWTYNGTIPGPLIRAHVGDHVIVHFTNHLPEETTIHWHGVRVSNSVDGDRKSTRLNSSHSSSP
jgi:FtsP/CotA-like multicopper oxidase with cupredoxin domain